MLTAFLKIFLYFIKYAECIRENRPFRNISRIYQHLHYMQRLISNSLIGGIQLFHSYADHIQCNFANMWEVLFSTFLLAPKWKSMGYSARFRTLTYIHWSIVTFELHCIELKRTTRTTALQQYYLKTFWYLYVFIRNS